MRDGEEATDSADLDWPCSEAPVICLQCAGVRTDGAPCEHGDPVDYDASDLDVEYVEAVAAVVAALLELADGDDATRAVELRIERGLFTLTATLDVTEKAPPGGRARVDDT